LHQQRVAGFCPQDVRRVPPAGFFL
jgi:hypothetical protein